jgi:hypothetical protein
MVSILIISNHYKKVPMIVRSKILLVDLRKVNSISVNSINSIFIDLASLLNPFYLPSDIKPSITNEVLSPPPAQRPVRRCNVCQQEFRNKALLRMHMNTFHSNEINKKQATKSSPTLTFPISPSTNLGFLQPFVDTTSPLAHKLVAGQAQQASYGILHDSYFCAKMADRVVCEICNKQVCNKYFLKTHKGKIFFFSFYVLFFLYRLSAKVHGIHNGNTSNDNSDHTPPTMVPIPADNDPIVKTSNDLENSETYCSICKKDFSTKYLYLFHMQTIHNDISDTTYQSLMEFMKAANSINEPLATIESGDESDGNMERLKRKRSLSQSSTETNKRMNSLTETNGGLQPFLLESEDPKFAHTFVPCMVYLPVIKRVTKQVKINLRLKPVLADASS